MQYLNAPFRQAKFKGLLLKRCLIYRKKLDPCCLITEKQVPFAQPRRALPNVGLVGQVPSSAKT